MVREADKKSMEYVDPNSIPPSDFTPPPEQPPPPPSSLDDQGDNEQGQTRAIIEEDDHFGQLSYSLGTPEYPEELTLSDETFGVHINSYSTTLVTFYVSCKTLVLQWNLRIMEGRAFCPLFRG